MQALICRQYKLDAYSHTQGVMPSHVHTEPKNVFWRELLVGLLVVIRLVTNNNRHGHCVKADNGELGPVKAHHLLLEKVILMLLTSNSCLPKPCR